MANVTLIFNGSETSETVENELKLFANNMNEIYISINDHSSPPMYICLDKSTAIKLSKELKKQISLI